MIATLSDAFRPELPLAILHAQARVSKIIVERGLPGRLIRLCTYLVATTSLKRSGRVFLSRAKVAALLNLSERTLDRYFGELEEHGFLQRQVRERAAGKFFFGTCVQWTESLWNALFLAPIQSRRTVLTQMRDRALAEMGVIQSNPNQGQGCAEPKINLPPSASPLPPSNQETIVSDNTAIPLTYVLKGRSLVKAQQQKPTFDSSPPGSNRQFRVPTSLQPWVQALKLEPSQVSLLLTIASKTDPNRTRTRLQDLLNYVGKRLLEGQILASNASKYLYRCLASGEDYSSARFSVAGASHAEEQREIEGARALRAALEQGRITLLGSEYLVRDDLTVYQVDPHVGLMGNSHRRWTREQMAKHAARCNLV